MRIALLVVLTISFQARMAFACGRTPLGFFSVSSGRLQQIKFRIGATSDDIQINFYRRDADVSNGGAAGFRCLKYSDNQFSFDIVKPIVAPTGNQKVSQDYFNKDLSCEYMCPQGVSLSDIFFADASFKSAFEKVQALSAQYDGSKLNSERDHKIKEAFNEYGRLKAKVLSESWPAFEKKCNDGLAKGLLVDGIKYADLEQRNGKVYIYPVSKTGQREEKSPMLEIVQRVSPNNSNPKNYPYHALLEQEQKVTVYPNLLSMKNSIGAASDTIYPKINLLGPTNSERNVITDLDTNITCASGCGGRCKRMIRPKIIEAPLPAGGVK